MFLTTRVQTLSMVTPVKPDLPAQASRVIYQLCLLLLCMSTGTSIK